MKILLCLDCDGTLYTEVSLIPPVKVAQKPIPLSHLEELEAAGVQLVLVSPSSACDHLPYPRITHPDRAQALRDAAARYPSPPSRNRSSRGRRTGKPWQCQPDASELHVQAALRLAASR